MGRVPARHVVSARFVGRRACHDFPSPCCIGGGDQAMCTGGRGNSHRLALRAFGHGLAVELPGDRGIANPDGDHAQVLWLIQHGMDDEHGQQ